MKTIKLKTQVATFLNLKTSALLFLLIVVGSVQAHAFRIMEDKSEISSITDSLNTVAGAARFGRPRVLGVKADESPFTN